MNDISDQLSVSAHICLSLSVIEISAKFFIGAPLIQTNQDLRFYSLFDSGYTHKISYLGVLLIYYYNKVNLLFFPSQPKCYPIPFSGLNARTEFLKKWSLSNILHWLENPQLRL